MTINTILILFYAGTFYVLWQWRPLAAGVFAFFGMVAFILWCCLAVGSDYDDRVDEEWRRDQ